LAHFEERAAIMEFDGGLAREEAERAGHTMVLSGLMQRIEVVIRGFEHDVAEQAGHLPRHSSDMLFALTMGLVQASTAPPGPKTNGDA
jgi:hypothetical protein